MEPNANAIADSQSERDTNCVPDRVSEPHALNDAEPVSKPDPFS